MINCYYCGEQLTSENKSVEHVIPNALGGRLKSTNLLCKRCNSTFGSEVDIVLAKNLGAIVTLLDISRDRGKAPSLLASRIDTGEGWKVYSDGTSQSRNPKVEYTSAIGSDGVRTIQVNIIARSEKEFAQIRDGVKKKNNVPGRELVFETKQLKETPSPEVQIPVVVGSDNTFRAIAKIALNYYLMCGHGFGHVQHLVRFVSGEESNKYVNSFYPPDDGQPVNTKIVAHRIFLKGDPVEKLLYAVIELFDIYKYIIVISGDYRGPAILECYQYDLLEQEHRDDEYLQHFTRVEVETAMQQRYFVKQDDLVERVTRVLRFSKKFMNIYVTKPSERPFS